MRLRTFAIVAGGAIVFGLPLLGHLLRLGGPARCAWDGLAIEPAYRIIVIDGGHEREFCCVQCAERWRQRHPDCVVFVTDETTGERIAVQAAWFANSSLATNRVTGNRVHVFRERADAEHHVARFGGELLEGRSRPFQ